MSRELKRIMHVEDDPDIRELTKIALEAVAGYTLDSATNGIEALEKTPAFEPDLILLDVMMPEMDGVETFQKLREIPKLDATPIVFVTAKAQYHEVEQYRSLGAADVIRKPFDPLNLPSEIESIWEREA